MQYLMKIITCYPSVYTMNRPDFIVEAFFENPTGLKRDESSKYKQDVTLVVVSCELYVTS